MVEDNDEVEDNDKDNNNDKGVSVLGLDIIIYLIPILLKTTRHYKVPELKYICYICHSCCCSCQFHMLGVLLDFLSFHGIFGGKRP